jgi:CRP-like cAMP-binding protein
MALQSYIAGATEQIALEDSQPLFTLNEQSESRHCESDIYIVTEGQVEVPLC